MTRSGLATMGAFLILLSTPGKTRAEEGSAPEPAKRSRVSVSGILASRYEAVWNVNPALDQSLDHNESKLLGYFTASLSVRPTDSIEGALNLASREVSRQTSDDGTLEDRWTNTRFIDEAWIKASHGSSWVKAGKQRLVIGRGLVLDSYQPAVSGNVAVAAQSPRVDLKAFGAGLDPDGVLREGQSLYAGARLDLSFPLAARVSASVSHVWDRNAMIPTLLPTTVQLALIGDRFQADDGALTYWIVDGAGRSGNWSVDGVAVLQTGAFSGTTPSTPMDITLLGKAARASAAYLVNRRLSLTVSGLYTSGDARGAVSTLSDQRYEGFVGIYPLVDATNLFFNGGIDSAFASGTPTASGVLGRGVLAGMLTANVSIDRATLRVVAADLWSEFASTDGSGRHYGVELDTEWGYALTDWLIARLEGDVLMPGSFYRTNTEPDPEPVYKLAIGADVVW